VYGQGPTQMLQYQVRRRISSIIPPDHWSFLRLCVDLINSSNPLSKY
jgi:hypothetical protein